MSTRNNIPGKVVKKEVNLSLIGLDGNAYAVMGAWEQKAKDENWTEEEIKLVLDEAMSSDYNYLLAIIQLHCK